MRETATTQLSPIRYEIFVHRLWAIGEEGRIALQKVSASPIVVQGGECMSSFYSPDGTMILACSGHLRFAAATSDAIKKLIECFGGSPGFFDGDQIFHNDPYVAGSHTYDQMVVMPIFYNGELIAWAASSSHTADTGGLLRGGATEVFHEGIKILGLKVVERGVFREDVFKTIVEQCRDPEYVGLDLKSRIAANNVCSRRFLDLVEKFGSGFIKAACQKLIRDSEELARAKLRALPDGTWRSRMYASALEPKTRKSQLIPIHVEIKKQKDELYIDLSGTGPQMNNDFNSTFPSTFAHVTIALTNQLFWDVPWNDGKMVPVHLKVPEGSILNCKYPAACGAAPMIGNFLVGALSECLSKMLFAGGLKDDVNACWTGWWYWGGPGYLYGGHNREGLTTAQGLYDIHGGGLGAAPTRDGVDSGGHMNIPSGGISDIEQTEMQYPFVYFTRRHVRDGSGFGKFRGGAGSERLLMIFGSKDASVDFRPYGAVPHGSFGLFGAHPTGYGGTRVLFTTDRLMDRLAKGEYPAGPDEVVPGDWGQPVVPEGNPTRIPLPEFSLIADYTQSGGGFGDPIDRAPEAVERDLQEALVSRSTAERLYGVVLDEAGTVNRQATDKKRESIRAERRSRGKPPAGKTSSVARRNVNGSVVLRFHEYLEVASAGNELLIRCRKCGHVFCSAAENYKLYALEIRQDLEELAGHRVPSGEPYVGHYLEYACPGCATLLQIDTYCPSQGGETPLWDIQLDAQSLARSP
ncbi:MAG: hydantoinase B/oxoprolinase family protein [Deltaproteobacteria bacterium]|nr:hydantoinase B/oxoprolinase family protein [Deltaproteobacteria bacterium]